VSDTTQAEGRSYVGAPTYRFTGSHRLRHLVPNRYIPERVNRNPGIEKIKPNYYRYFAPSCTLTLLGWQSQVIF
jgi:hypothetical protein